jgi:GDP-L-fucose synthase
MAAASVFVMELDKKTYDQQTDPMQSHINVGFGSDITIAELAKAVGQAVGYAGTISFDKSKPDGTLRKWMDSSRLNQLGWSAEMGLGEGLMVAYNHFVQDYTLNKT